MGLTRLYSNLSIGRKLVIGFTLLIVLAVLIGLTGLQTITRYGERSAIVSATSSIKSALLSARIEEKNILLRKSEQDVEKAQLLSQEVIDQADRLQQQLVVPSDLELLATIEDGTQRYQALLEEMAAVVVARAQAINTLEDDAWKLEGRLSIEEDLFAANSVLKQLRRDERGYLMNNQTDVLMNFDVTADRAIRTIKSSSLDDDFKGQIVDLFNLYLDDFKATISINQTSQELEAAMVAVARASVEAAETLQAIQLAKMDDARTQAVTMIIAATAAVIALGILLAVALTRSIVRPIREAVNVAQEVANGDLRTQVSSRRGDELGQLLNALGAMVTNLRELVQGINAGATNIASSAEELSTVTRQASAGVTQQRDQTDQVATAMNEMVATVNEVARSAEEAFSAAGHASEKSTVGEHAVGETLSYVTKLNTEVENATTRIRGLQTDTHNIGSVLDVIKSVADQTNLLALNAAIEAARAGEQGRGFAVVADEVRSLAKRTQSSASEIEKLIGNLVSSAESSVKTMESGTALANQTLTSARSTGDTIKDIGLAVEEIRQYNNQIATAAEEQSSVAENINENVTLIRDVSDQSATSTEQVASASNELAQLGESLREQVARFRI
ncbi:HAMP domain-containing methyl-accepting chemotaxis protein [Marinobacter caseinilyticus]|uniref:HAMP domain-containing methyl-accepting chemotaxis protein n=1 Tax=Marinobacter caseinilyticus TaxID=2692195 RepID=UPI00140C67B3|nr:methyl-accepting chemotaxis protein [Marinobacter caseinilyticus]